MTDFSNNIDGSALIFGGYPSYFIDINYDRYKVGNHVYQITYTVFMREADGGALINSSRASEICLDTKSIISFPAPCDSLRYKILEAALFGL
jgi:hypothetical protein